MNKKPNQSSHPNQYVDRATDILVELIKKTRSKLPPTDKEAMNFTNQLRSVKKLDGVFQKNADDLMKLIRSKKNSNK